MPRAVRLVSHQALERASHLHKPTPKKRAPAASHFKYGIQPCGDRLFARWRRGELRARFSVVQVRHDTDPREHCRAAHGPPLQSGDEDGQRRFTSPACRQLSLSDPRETASSRDHTAKAPDCVTDIKNLAGPPSLDERPLTVRVCRSEHLLTIPPGCVRRSCNRSRATTVFRNLCKE